MNDIEKARVIDRSRLSAQHYFLSLVEEAYRNELLSDAQLERIQLQCLELLSFKVERYNGGDSSSIRVEVAQSIMTSNLYTLGLFLKTYPEADEAVDVLKAQPIQALYVSGRTLIDTKLKTAKYLHSLVLRTLLATENYTYHSTVVDGIHGFFKIYNPDYDAQDIHITADYPPANPINPLVGIEFIVKYLEAIYYENMFCENFSTDRIHRLLCGYDEHYQDLVFNLFEQVLTAAIGCTLAGLDPLALNMTEKAVLSLAEALSGKTKEDIHALVQGAYHRLLPLLPAKDALLARYIKRRLPDVAATMFHAVALKTLHKVFVSPDDRTQHPQLLFSFGTKMDDERYRKVIEHLLACETLPDKIALIKRAVHSLADLEDVIFDAALTEADTKALLAQLEPAELAALAMRHPLGADTDVRDMREAEQRFRASLASFIAALPVATQALIAQIIPRLAEDNA